MRSPMTESAAQRSCAVAELVSADMIHSKTRVTAASHARPIRESSVARCRMSSAPSRRRRNMPSKLPARCPIRGIGQNSRVNTKALFGAAVLIWGTTWFAIKFQLDAVEPEFGVALRFLLAALLVLGWCAWRGLSLRLSANAHGWLLLQGACGFSVAYVLIYHAERFIVSGLVAVGYAAAPLTNMLLARVFFGTPMARRVAIGGMLGLAGIVPVWSAGRRSGWAWPTAPYAPSASRCYWAAR